MDVQEEKEKLDKYLAQKVQIDLLLKQHPNNKDLLKLKEELSELIIMTNNFLEMKENEAKSKVTSPTPLTKATSPEPKPQDDLDGEEEEEEEDEFDRDINKYLMENKEEDEEDENQMKFEKGNSCKALWSGDGQWYDAIVETVHYERGTYTVVFVGYGNKEEVSPSCIISINETPESSTNSSNPTLSYTPNNKIGREFSNPNNVALKPIPIPEALRIKPDDPKEVVIAKKKKLHAIKSQNRFQQLEAETKSKQNAWKQFVSGTTRKKGASINKKSMFSTPESVTGKVGVIGSGQGMTTHREKKVEHKKTKISLPPSEDELRRLDIPPTLE